MKILIINDFFSTGGAAIACKRMIDCSRTSGLKIESISCDETSDGNHRVLFLGKKYQIFHALFGSLFKKSVFRKLQEIEFNRQFHMQLTARRYDLINVHNLHGAELPISLINNALKFSPVVCTLHDCWIFSGAYYPTHCSSPNTFVERRINSFWQKIEKLRISKRLSAISPSEWLKNQALESKWEGMKISAIHNPIPDFFFEKQDRQACKKALGISCDKTVILCIAGNLSEERKGGPILKEILNSSLKENVQFLLIGANGVGFLEYGGVYHLGFISNDITLRMAYHAADLLLHPAPIDNLPNTVAESMSCGTPVLAFKTGGLPEMVKPQKSGWLIQEINSESMVRELGSIVKSKAYKNLRGSTRQTAFELFHHKKIAQSYQKHFQLVKNQG